MLIQHTFALGALGLGALLLATNAEAASPQQLLALNPALGQLPESVAVDANGNFYVSMGSQVAKIDSSYALSTLADLPLPAGAFATGVKFAPNGRLFVASGAFNPALDASYVFSVDASSGGLNVETALDPDGFPNDMAFDDAGTTYLTDSFLGVVWKLAPDGTASIWASDPLLLGNPSAPVFGLPFGANGIVFDRAKRKLFVANTDLGAILQIRVGANGAPGDVEVFASAPELVGADGLAMDRAGKLYVAVNAQDQLATVDKRGRIAVLASGGLLDSPSSLAFGAAHCDRHSLFITNFAIMRASGAKPGTPNPGLLSLRVSTPGLKLP
jgi:sugar lactone lactonase YvrE